nr:MAG TPA: hypothetical protein [Caudoviricetes sp.]DAR21178.1 MAG TPA: hypothetical protein [Caudoviricetes sp.]
MHFFVFFIENPPHMVYFYLILQQNATKYNNLE